MKAVRIESVRRIRNVGGGTAQQISRSRLRR
jgi:hypothetical protein